MDGRVNPPNVIILRALYNVCMYVCMYTPFAVAFAFHRRTSTNVCIFLYQSLKKGKTDRQTDGTNERNGTKERNRKAQKTKTKSQKKKSVSISNHLLITMNNLNMDGWNR